MAETFTQAVYRVVRIIPAGSVLTYKEVAIRAGYPGAYRAVGTVLGKNQDPTVPCHRVIRTDGELGGYRDGTEKKRDILREEGVDRAILKT